MSQQAPLPLDGVVVLDCTQVMAGPFCTLLLGDMGADVIKVERPEGDDVRRQGPPWIAGRAASFMAINRNKRSIVLNLRTDEGKEVFRTLARRADVVTENFRPGTMDRLGLGYKQLGALKPELIYAAISGFGQTGPYSQRRGFDLVAQGMSGLMSVTGHPDTPPVKVGVPITDLTSGMYAAYGILNAYIHRLKTGRGQMVDTSLLEAGIAYSFWESTVYFYGGEVPGPLGSAHRLSAPYQAFRTSDGYMNIGGATQRTWASLCKAIGREELTSDPRFIEPGDRKMREAELAATLEEAFSTGTTDHWMKVLDEAGVPCGPINDLDQVYNDPHVLAREMLVEQQDPDVGTLKNIGIPVKLSETPGRIRRRAPDLGQHTREVLLEAGYTGDDVDRMRDAGTVKEGG
ncbi:MAG: CoA transferase [Dehalococcoidia bacterium]|nr:CoA transferase [Dehalococcoidia bacterium]